MSAQPQPRYRVNWTAMREAIARRAWQEAHAAAGPMRKDDLEYRRAYDEVEAAKAVEVAELVEAWRGRKKP